MKTPLLRLRLCLLLVALCAALGCTTEDAESPDSPDQKRDTSQDLESWRMCLAEPKAYSPFEDSISTIGRIEGYEKIAKLLWRSQDLMPDDFTQANLVYVEAEGLDSRLSRREDEHYPPAKDSAGNVVQCRDQGVPMLAPERCAGPAILRPKIIEAFTQGAKEQAPLDQEAAKVEANLQWFLYLSSFKEAKTCEQKKKDCDSSFAYYTGGDTEGKSIGLAKEINDVSQAANAQIIRAIQGIGCWRSIDNTDQAQNLELSQKARTFLDEALLHGMSVLVARRLDEADKAPDWIWLQTIGAYLDRAARERDPAKADALKAEFSKEDGTNADANAIKTALAELFPIPSIPM